ncbi:MAG TPA: hypothetical protein VK943_15360 [Arenibaculum sp.]|nr:hypothetical protein [Arenibaculum sp.]
MGPALVLALVLGICVVPVAAQQSAAPGIRLSPEATRQLEKTEREGFTPNPEDGYRPNQIRTTGDAAGEGALYYADGVFVGRVRRSANPFHPRARYWVFDEGIYALAGGARYAGRFYFFHEDRGEYNYIMEGWEEANAGRYIMVGSRIDREGNAVSGIYGGDIGANSVSDFTPADESYLAWLEGRYDRQVQSFEQAQAAESGGGLSFGQVLALGLGGLALSQANVPSADAVGIGGAFVSDVLTGGRSNALAGIVQEKRNPATGTATASPQGDYEREEVAIDCPSGASSSIPISYRTTACRGAMIDYARVYSCNMIGDIGRATQACKSACGNAQCRE